MRSKTTPACRTLSPAPMLVFATSWKTGFYLLALSIDIVINTHLHADHCGGNHLFAGKPIYVQRRELEDARAKRDEYPVPEWVDAPGVEYLTVDGEFELLPGLRLVPAPGHTDGMQVVVIETEGRPIVVGGDVAVWFWRIGGTTQRGPVARSCNESRVDLAGT